MFIVILGLAIFIYLKYIYTYSEGLRTGLLQKFSKKGFIFKTYEGELILSSVVSNANVPLASEKFFFSVMNDSLALQLDTLQGQFVTVHYKEKKGTLPWRGDTKYFVDGARLKK